MMPKLDWEFVREPRVWTITIDDDTWYIKQINEGYVIQKNVNEKWMFTKTYQQDDILKNSLEDAKKYVESQYGLGCLVRNIISRFLELVERTGGLFLFYITVVVVILVACIICSVCKIKEHEIFYTKTEESVIVRLIEDEDMKIKDGSVYYIINPEETGQIILSEADFLEYVGNGNNAVVARHVVYDVFAKNNSDICAELMSYDRYVYPWDEEDIEIVQKEAEKFVGTMYYSLEDITEVPFDEDMIPLFEN